MLSNRALDLPVLVDWRYGQLSYEGLEEVGLMRLLLLILIYVLLCPVAGHFLGIWMVQTALQGQQPTLLTIYAVRTVAMVLAYVIVGPLLKAFLVPRRQ